MRKFFNVLLLLTAVNASTSAAKAAEPGWVIDQISNAQGKQHILITPHAISITLPKQKCRIYSFSPKWNVIHINDQIGTYIEFQHKQYMGSILGRLGTQMGNDIQMLPLPKPKLVKENGIEYAVYDHAIPASDAERRRMLHGRYPTALYAPRAFTAKYLRLSEVPKEAKELTCKVSCVPMSSDLPLSFTCMDGFKHFKVVLTTAQKPKANSIDIVPPDLKDLKRVKKETELFSRSSVNDVFELFDDAAGEKKSKQ